MKRPELCALQMILLMVGSQLMLSYTFLPVASWPPGNQDTWAVVILSILFQVIFALPFLYIISQFRGKSAYEIAHIIHGKFIGNLIISLFCLLTVFCFYMCTFMDVVFIRSSIFPETPNWAILLTILIPAGYMAYKGAGVLGRMAVFIVPYIILTILFFLVLSLHNLDWNILKPVLADTSMQELTKGAFLNAAIKTEVYLLTILGVFLNYMAKPNRIFAQSVALTALLTLMILVPTICLLGVDITKHAWNPYFLFSKQVKAYDFIQRAEFLNVLAWFFGSLLRSGLYCFMASYVLSQMIKKAKCNTFVIPFCAVVFILVMIPKITNAQVLDNLTSYRVLPWLMFPFVFLLPSFGAITLFIKKRTGKLNTDKVPSD